MLEKFFLDLLIKNKKCEFWNVDLNKTFFDCGRVSKTIVKSSYHINKVASACNIGSQVLKLHAFNFIHSRRIFCTVHDRYDTFCLVMMCTLSTNCIAILCAASFLPTHYEKIECKLC